MLDELLPGLLPVLAEMDAAREAEGGGREVGIRPRFTRVDTWDTTQTLTTTQLYAIHSRPNSRKLLQVVTSRLYSAGAVIAESSTGAAPPE